MKMMMMTISLILVLIGLVNFAAAAGQGSCSGRCGEVFTRGQQCTCDLECLQHNECCPDFQALCTTTKSCLGRCGEAFRRGQTCECDPACVLYNTCCHDFNLHCDARVSVSQPSASQSQRATTSGKRKSDKNQKGSNSESEERYTASRRCSQNPRGRCPGAAGLKPHAASSSHLLPAAVLTNPQPGLSNFPRLQSMPNPSTNNGAPYSPALGSSLPSLGAPSLGSSAPVSPPGPGAAGGQVNIHLVLSPGGMGVPPTGPNQGVSVPAVPGPGPGPSTLQEVAQALGIPVMGGGVEAPEAGLLADVNLCSDSPINGLTALINGTILIFKGEFFWSVDPVSRLVGSPQNITETLGVSAPIDTVFTRVNCHGHTYIIKGDQYWRLDGNLVLEPGYPKPLTAEFPGLTGGVSAALAVPATISKPETVFFFSNGDVMQRFAFLPGSVPPCEKIESPLLRRLARQAEVPLSQLINITVALTGFPVPITSALTVQNLQEADRYEHYVFSGPLFFSVQISGDLPALVKPDPSAGFAPQPVLSPIVEAIKPNPPRPANSLLVWLRCV